MTAAAASEIGQHCSRVSGSAIGREASTSATVSSPPYWARGLASAWAWFFTDTCAICSGVTQPLAR